MKAGGLLVATALLAGGCGRSQPQPWSRFERMIDQRRNDAFAASTLFLDGKAMQAPPAGTVPRDRLLGPSRLLTGREDDGNYAAAIPVTLDAAGLNRGRRTFGIYCAACHGVTGEGQSPVADAMALSKPPSFFSDRVRVLAPGRIFAVVTEGYGLMPSYAAQIPVPERWEVVGYVEALQLSRSLHLSDLPPALQAEFREKTGASR